MKLIRCGSDAVNVLTPSSLWVQHLPGAAINDLVTVETDEGDSFVGRVVEVGRDSCHVRICDGEHVLCRNSLRVWLGSDETELPAVPPPVPSVPVRRTIFKTGVAPVDALFPLQRGHSVFLAGVTLRQSLPFISSLLQGAVADHQWPCMISLDTTKNESQAIHNIWNSFGLEDEGLFVSDSRDQLYQTTMPLRRGFEAAAARADEGRNVFLTLLDLESWFRFYQEDLALRGQYRSRESALYGFKNAVWSYMQLLFGHKGRITVLALLSERRVAGMPSELLVLRDLFDGFLELRRDGSLSLAGYMPQPPRGSDRAVEYARLLRRQCKDLQQLLLEKQRDEYPLTEQEQAFSSALHQFLSDLGSRPSADTGRIWQILALLPESELNRVPLSLLREHCRQTAQETVL
ncbi:MAG: hypothetical protein ACI4NN_08535 [Pyramidobacter sp.]|jgi:hypothetical protein